MHSVKSEIFSIKLWRKLTEFYPMTIISSDHKNVIQFFRNHLPCPRILKMIRRNDSTPLIRHSWQPGLHYAITFCSTHMNNRTNNFKKSLFRVIEQLNIIFCIHDRDTRIHIKWNRSEAQLSVPLMLRKSIIDAGLDEDDVLLVEWVGPVHQLPRQPLVVRHHTETTARPQESSNQSIY